MTTNQTIDGVPRELLENCASYMEGSASGTVRIWHDRLRALLDAPVEPVEVVQADNADQALTLLDFALSFALCNMDHGGTRRDVKKAQAHLESYRKFKAAQPQGEPVAYRCRHSATEPWFFSDKPGYWEWQALYAEQPAPVAVVGTRTPFEIEHDAGPGDEAAFRQWRQERLNTARPAHANPPPGTEPSGTHHDNDGLDDYRNTK